MTSSFSVSDDWFSAIRNIIRVKKKNNSNNTLAKNTYFFFFNKKLIYEILRLYRSWNSNFCLVSITSKSMKIKRYIYIFFNVGSDWAEKQSFSDVVFFLRIFPDSLSPVRSTLVTAYGIRFCKKKKNKIIIRDGLVNITNTRLRRRRRHYNDDARISVFSKPTELS